MEVLETQAVEDLFRFALLLSGKRGVALGMVARALGEAESRASQFRAERTRWIWTACWMWGDSRKMLQNEVFGSDLDADLKPFFDPLLLMDRAALALRALHHLEVQEIAQILDQRPKELRQTLGRLYEARQAAALDESILRDGVLALLPTAEEKAGLFKPVGAGKSGRGRGEKWIVVAAVVFGLVFLAGFMAWERWRTSETTMLRDQMTRLLEFNESANIAEFEPVEGDAGAVGDWLYLHGIDAVHLPPALRKLKIVAGRVAQWHGGEVAQLVSEEPRAVLLILDKKVLGVGDGEVVPGNLSTETWSAQWESHGRQMMLLAVRGMEDELRAVYSGLAEGK